jgi:hypothetical protein
LHKHSQSNSCQVAEVLEAGAAEYLRHSLEHSPDPGAWTKLYATSRTLLSAMREGRVLAALVEICSNLLACEQLAIVEIESQTSATQLLCEEGLHRKTREALIQNARLLEPRIVPGSASISSDNPPANAGFAALGISAVVPLWKDGKSSGAMVLFQLLPQCSGFDSEDRQVLQLLSLYAGPCLRSQWNG